MRSVSVSASVSVSSEEEGEGKGVTTVIPSRICVMLGGEWCIKRRGRKDVTLQGVLGIARTTFVEGKTQFLICDIVTPARMLMSSLPSKASLSPSSLRIECASWGLQLLLFPGR